MFDPALSRGPLGRTLDSRDPAILGAMRACAQGMSLSCASSTARR